MSVQKTKTGYIVRWREGSVQKAKRFPVRAEAVAWDDEVRRRKRMGPLALQQLTVAGPTLAEWIVDRWAPEHATALETRTRDSYADMYERHVAPWLGSLPLRDITVGTVRRWQADRLASGVTVPQVIHARTVLSSVLRHAAESEAIAANPMTLVRAPRRPQRDEVRPLAPATVEAIRAALAGDLRHEVGASTATQRRRQAHTQPDRRPAHIKIRDTTLVSVLAYGGLRPGEALALRWSDLGERTILVERATDPDGSIKSTKGRNSRSVRILAPVARDLREWFLASGRPDARSLVFPQADGSAWTTDDWGNWRNRTWKRACVAAGLDPIPRPYDLRHSFVSLLLAEGRTIHYVAGQAGHAAQMTFDRYGHVVAELEDRGRVDAEAEIRRARSGARRSGLAA